MSVLSILALFGALAAFMALLTGVFYCILRWGWRALIALLIVCAISVAILIERID